MNNKTNFRSGILALAAILFIGFSVSDAFSYGKGWKKDGKRYHKGCNKGNYHGFKHLERLETELDLSEKQVEKIFDIGSKYRVKYFQNRTDTKKLDKLRVEHRKEIESVLNKEQKEKFNNKKYWGHGWKKKDCPYRK